MTQHATGTFEVNVTPLEPAFKFDDNALSRMSLDKQFHGDLEAISKGEMLAAGSPNKGSGGYVAMERASGALHGRTGTFVLQHSGTMANGSYQMHVNVVPDSGTGQLAGLTGAMTIIIKDGLHSYDFAYTLSEAAFIPSEVFGTRNSLRDGGCPILSAPFQRGTARTSERQKRDFRCADQEQQQKRRLDPLEAPSSYVEPET